MAKKYFISYNGVGKVAISGVGIFTSDSPTLEVKENVALDLMQIKDWKVEVIDDEAKPKKQNIKKSTFDIPKRKSRWK
jgi:hypothetical protein